MTVHYCTARQDNVPMPATTGYCRWCGLDHGEIIERHDAQQARWRREARQAETEARFLAAGYVSAQTISA